LLTADRPPELIDCAANQAIRQPGIYSHFVRAELNLEAPDQHTRLASTLVSIDHCLAQSDVGPVHINCPFREPLYPADSGFQAEQAEQAEAGHAVWPELALCPGLSTRWLKGNQLYSRIDDGAGAAAIISASSALTPLAEAELENAKVARIKEDLVDAIEPGDWQQCSVLVVAGQLRPEEGKALVALCVQMQWPLLADLHSHCGYSQHPLVLTRFGFWLEHEPALDQLKHADMILQFGVRLTDKHLQNWLRRNAPKEHWLVAEADHCPDPDQRVSRWINQAVGQVIASLTAGSSQRGSIDRPLTCWHRELAELDRRCEGFINGYFQQTRSLTEASVCWQLCQLLPASSQCFTGNSLPIRLMNWFASRADIHWFCQRGASGIDGIIAHACGVHLSASVSTTLMLGDLSFLHDLNSLALLRDTVVKSQTIKTQAIKTQAITSQVINNPEPFIMVVLNNNGGNIFRFLPVSDELRKPLFQTPHELTLEPFCRGFGLRYKRPDMLVDFSMAYEAALKNKEHTVIEVVVPENGAYDQLTVIRQQLKLCFS